MHIATDITKLVKMTLVFFRNCMKTSSVLEMQHFLGYQIKMN